ncbi:MAG: endonuclease V, partial [Spirochaetota bacterium]|nr:endonuclease V [Spirochaetota bacterium]
MSMIKHKWDVTPKEAVAIQRELQKYIIIKRLDKEINTIAGADISFNKKSNEVYAGIVVLKYPELIEIDRSLIKTNVSFPYIPGLLSFREIPPLIEAWNKLKISPDVVMLDGQGIAHPRRLGIASHFGLIVDKPTIGCAKSLLIGTYEKLEEGKNNYKYLFDKDEIIG